MHQHKLVPTGHKLVVGVSGGADSLALLHTLHTLRETLEIELHAATLDHGLRGSAGAEDVRFVVATCQAWGIPVTAGTTLVESHDGSIEQAARIARYDFLAQVAQTVGARHIAVAHHADDQAETVLLHLIRGTGLQGLGGMSFSAPLPGYPEFTLIRPLLHATRQAIESYCQAHDLQPRQDVTNQDKRLTRNRVRLETLPYLRQINPHVDRALTHLAMIAAADHEFIRRELETRISGASTITADRVTLARDRLRQLPPALRNHFILYAVQQLGGRDTGFEHVLQAVDLALHGQTGQMALLPGSIRLRLDYETIVIEKAGAPPAHDGPLLPAGTLLDVAVPGTTSLPNSRWKLHAGWEPFASDKPQLRLAVASGQPMQLRTRRPGDRFKPRGLGGHTQKIKKWMIDHKIPQAVRDQIPILTINGDIAALMTGNQWVISESLVPDDREQAILYAIFTQ